MKHLLIYLALFSLMVGCSTLNEYERTARLTTMYATIKVVDDDQAKAERVEEIAGEVKRYAQDAELLTIDALIDTTRSLIDWSKLDAADRLLVDALLLELEDRLKERFGDDTVLEDLRLTVDKVADWVIEAAQMI